MKTETALPGIDFSEATIQRILIENSTVTVSLEDWTEKEIVLKFTNYISLIDRGAVVAEIDGIEKVLGVTEFLKSSLDYSGVDFNRFHDLYRHFVFLYGRGESPVLEIIAMGLEIRAGDPRLKG